MRKYAQIAASVAIALLLFVGCQHTQREMRSAARHLDAVENQMSEWGRITVSDIALVPEKGQFRVDYGTNTEFYVNAARNQIQGAARSSTEQTLSILASLKASLTPPISAGQPGMAVLPAASTNNGGAAPLPTSLGSNSPASGNFSDALRLLTNSNYSISERQAMMIGMNDKIAEMLLKFLAHPEDLPKNRRVLLGVTQVSCQPGSRTRENYIADVNVALYYMDDDGKSSVNDKEVFFPSAWAVLPLLDAQQLDLRSSQRNQFQLGLDLALAMYAQGITGNAGVLVNYLKKKESDMVSRSVIPLAASYTDSGSFGFQILPAFQAIGDPAKAYDHATDRLQPMSFPVVVVLLVDTDDLMQADSKGTKKPKWTNIRADVRSRWIPIKGSGKNLTNLERVETGLHLDEARKTIRRENQGSARDDYRHAFGELERSYGALWRYALSTTYTYSLTELLSDVFSTSPPPPPAPPQIPSISAVAPEKAWVNAPTVLSIQGDNFTEEKKSIVTSVTVGGQKCEIAYVGPKVMIAILPGWTEHVGTLAKPAQICVTTKNGMVVWGQSLAFEYQMSEKQERVPVMQIARDNNGNVTGLTVQSTGGMGAKELLESIKAWLPPLPPKAANPNPKK